MLNRKQRKEDLMELPIDTIVNMFLDLEEECDTLANVIIEIIDKPIESETEEDCDESCQCRKDKLCKDEYL